MPRDSAKEEEGYDTKTMLRRKKKGAWDEVRYSAIKRKYRQETRKISRTSGG